MHRARARLLRSGDGRQRRRRSAWCPTRRCFPTGTLRRRRIQIPARQRRRHIRIAIWSSSTDVRWLSGWLRRRRRRRRRTVPGVIGKRLRSRVRQLLRLLWRRRGLLHRLVEMRLVRSVLLRLLCWRLRRSHGRKRAGALRRWQGTRRMRLVRWLAVRRRDGSITGCHSSRRRRTRRDRWRLRKMTSSLLRLLRLLLLVVRLRIDDRRRGRVDMRRRACAVLREGRGRTSCR